MRGNIKQWYKGKSPLGQAGMRHKAVRVLAAYLPEQQQIDINGSRSEA